MPRRRIAKKRRIEPDPKYGSYRIAKLINKVMWDGKKTIAQKIVYGAMDYIKEKTGEEPLQYVHKAIEKVEPEIETRTRRVGGANYQVPVDVPKERRLSLAIRWIVNYARARSGKSMIEKLANEIIDAYNGRGGAIKKREDTHKMAEANRAFAHFRW